MYCNNKYIYIYIYIHYIYIYITPARDPKQCGRNEALRADSWKQVIVEAGEMESWKYDGMEL